MGVRVASSSDNVSREITSIALKLSGTASTDLCINIIHHQRNAPPEDNHEFSYKRAE